MCHFLEAGRGELAAQRNGEHDLSGGSSQVLAGPPKVGEPPPMAERHLTLGGTGGDTWPGVGDDFLDTPIDGQSSRATVEEVFRGHRTHGSSSPPDWSAVQRGGFNATQPSATRDRQCRPCLVQWLTVEWVFDGEVIEWRGPAPHFFVVMPEPESAELKEEARSLIYWGQVPVTIIIGRTKFGTALFPKDGRYLVPLKVAVRNAERINKGDIVTVTLRPGRPEAR